MPEKTVREMSALERQRYSLAARVFHASALHSVILGLLCFLIGFGMYLNAMAQQSMKEAYDAAQESLTAVCAEVEPGVYSAQTMEVYHSLAGAEQDGEAYYSRFEEMNELCEEHEWIPISMKNDWTTIYGEGVTKK